MDYISRLQRGVDYAEHHLNEELPLSKVAEAASMSLWHFQRTFRAAAGETIKDYIRSRRLHLASRELVETENRILDIALRAGYESQESFTRAFKKAYDATPAHYRESRALRTAFPKLKIDEDYLCHLYQGVSLEPEIYHQAPLTLVGLQTEFFSGASELNNVSAKLPPLWLSFLPRMHEIRNAVAGLCYGVIRPIANDIEQLEYYCAMAVTEATELPPGMVRIEIPGCTYAKFRHQGNISKIDDTINYLYSAWLPQSGYRHTGGPDLEFYDAQYIPNSDQSVMYYAIPIE